MNFKDNLKLEIASIRDGVNGENYFKLMVMKIIEKSPPQKKSQNINISIILIIKVI